MKSIIFILSTVLLCGTVKAQINYPGQPTEWNNKSFNIGLPTSVFKALDVEPLLTEDKLNESLEKEQIRFGISHEVSINPLEDGDVQIGDNGEQIYRYEIECRKATSISMIFGSYHLSEGVSMYIWSKNRSSYLGRFDQRNTSSRSSLAVGLLLASNIVIEVIVPANVDPSGNVLEITEITQGYRHLFNGDNEMLSAESGIEKGPYGTSQACQKGINCPEGIDWQLEKRGVGIQIVSGFTSGTGYMVNNTNNDGTPYYLMADHSVSPGIENAIFYFDYETPSCSGSGGLGGPTISLSGCQVVANNYDSDFGLLLIDETPPPSYNIQFLGWDATDIPSVTSGVSIHHPGGDFKKISLFNSNLTQSVESSVDVWDVSFDVGSIEVGSSGSPLFDQNHRVIGVLALNSNSMCDPFNPYSAFIGGMCHYGRFGRAWNDGATPSARLKDWLDPGNTGMLVLDSYPIAYAVVDNDVALLELSGFEESVCDQTQVDPIVIIKNNGLLSLVSCDIIYSVNGGSSQTYNWTGSLNTNQQETIQLSSIGLAVGMNTVEVTVENPNGTADINDYNNSREKDVYSFAPQLFNYSLVINFPLGADEYSWSIDTDSGEEVYFKGSYPNSLSETTITEDICLGEGCYVFTMYNSYGWGMIDGGPPGFVGSYELIDPSGGIAVSGADFEYEDVTQFCASSTGVNEESFGSQYFWIYPNPTDDFLAVSIDPILDAVSFQLLDMSGKTIIQPIDVTDTKMQIDVSKLSSGVYVFILKTNTEILHQKVIIK